MSESDLYAKLLFPRRHGYPLWKPTPNLQLPQEYRSIGQRIGDVGIITRDGGFDFLFNICYKADHPIHVRGVPPNFIPINPATLELDEHYPFHNPKTDITTQNIRKTDIQFGVSVADNMLPSGAAAGFEFHVASRSSEGAILMLPDGASRMDLHNRKPFYEMACQNATAWYQYATETRGRMISDDSLYLVTGCDKCTSWGVAAFSETFGAVGSTLKLIATGIGGVQGALTYSWEKPTSVAARSGPGYLPDQGQTFLNNCVFLRGFKISLRRRRFSKPNTRITLIEENKAGPVLPKAIVSEAGNSQSTQSGLFARTHSTTEMHQRLESADMEPEYDGSSSPLSGSSEEEMLLQEFPEPSESVHPLDSINQYLLNKLDSEIAVTHDDVWTSVLDASDQRLPDLPDFISRIEKRYPMILHEGVASFASDFHERASSTPDCTDDDMYLGHPEENLLPKQEPFSSFEKVRQPLDMIRLPSTLSSRPKALKAKGAAGAKAKGAVRTKAKGAVRTESSCYTCRIRRKKCDQKPDHNNACETCVRLRLECLGKRPDWLQEKSQVLTIREKIKIFLTSQGMIRGHSGNGAHGEDEPAILRPAIGSDAEYCSSSDIPQSQFLTLSSADDFHPSHNMSEARDEPFRDDWFDAPSPPQMRPDSPSGSSTGYDSLPYSYQPPNQHNSSSTIA